MSDGWRVFQPSRQWVTTPWSTPNLETCWIPICMPTEQANLLFYLQRSLNQAPFLFVLSNRINLQIPTITSKIENHLVSCFDGQVFSSESKCVKDSIAQFPIMSILIRGLVRNTGRDERYWVQVDADSQKRRTTGKETLICQYFKNHLLAETNLLFVIISFL